MLERLDNLLGKFLMLRNMATSAPVPGGMPPNPAAQPELNPGRPASGGNALQLLSEITPPLITALTNPDISGADFAEWFIDGEKNLAGQWTGGYGIRVHDTVKLLGKEGILAAARNFPALWAQLEPLGMDRINTFLDEFLSWPPPPDDTPEEPAAPTPITKGKKAK